MILFIYIAIKTSSFIGLSKLVLNAQKHILPSLETMGELLHYDIRSATNIYILIFTLGGFCFYCLLYQSKLVPIFLSIWGLFGVLLLFIKHTPYQLKKKKKCYSNRTY